MNKTLFLSFLIQTSLLTVAHAQPFARQVEPFPVTAGSDPIALPFTGGINSPLHQFVDIDGDGDLDLFVFDNDLGMDFYRNEGTLFIPRYALRNDLVSIPGFFIWFRFVDFDGDGRIDLCTEDSTFQGIRVFKNTGTSASPEFSEIIPTIKDTSGADVYTGGNSIPVFIDIDGDGDFDIISANASGTVNLYRNVGTPTLPRYAFTSGNWENILIFGDTCTTTLAAVQSPAHGAAAYSFADIDGDGDYDMFIGDLFSVGVFHIQNTGTPLLPQMQCATAFFPQNEPVHTGGFNQTSFVDIDGDGDLDMFVGTLAGIVQRDGFIFYRNNGSPTSPLLQRVTNNFISTIDVGMNANTEFTDIDGDGDQDMFVGNLLGELTFFRNTGTATLPSFMLVDSFYVRVTNGYYLAPAFVDIDNDGDVDLFTGMFDGTLKFFRNNGTPQNPQLVQSPFVTDTIDVGNIAAPAFVDIDGDGDMDLFIGSQNGTIRFYRNIGSASTFIPQLDTPSFLNIALGPNMNVTPTFCDIDGDGDVDLFFGAEDGRVEFYENIGSATNPQFVQRTSSFGNTAQTQESVPHFVDIDGDGDPDLFVGTRKGGIHFYRNNRFSTAVEEYHPPLRTELVQNYPNPFNATTTVSFSVEIQSKITLDVYNILGQKVATLVNESLLPGSYSVPWDANGFPSGVYVYTLATSIGTFSKRMILLK
ncbi:MAG: T9SS type A sorting domain-containing protein [Bacteroidetes bacterium]|nr:T9SS type A sorting domain-containing protein [Bacteroidota bacterium]